MWIAYEGSTSVEAHLFNEMIPTQGCCTHCWNNCACLGVISFAPSTAFTASHNNMLQNHSAKTLHRSKECDDWEVLMSRLVIIRLDIKNQTKCSDWWLTLCVRGDSLNPVCWVPKAPQQGNCILIQSTPLCVSVIQPTIVSGICIRAMKFNPVAFTM